MTRLRSLLNSGAALPDAVGVFLGLLAHSGAGHASGLDAQPHDALAGDRLDHGAVGLAARRDPANGLFLRGPAWRKDGGSQRGLHGVKRRDAVSGRAVDGEIFEHGGGEVCRANPAG